MLNINQYPTYMACSNGQTPGSQDAFALTGGSTVNAYVLKAGISSLQSTAGVNAWFLAKRSAANSGGTHTAPTIVPVQSSLPASGCTVLQYTANPTAGTLVGNLWSGLVNSPGAATAGIGGYEGVEIDFLTLYGQPIALLNANEVLAWNFNGASVPSGIAVYCWMLWCEIPTT